MGDLIKFSSVFILKEISFKKLRKYVLEKSHFEDEKKIVVRS